MSLVSVPREAGIYAVDLGGTIVGGITRQEVNTGTELVSEWASGEVYPRTNFITAQKPGANFSCLALKALLDITTLFGKDITTLSGGMKMYLQQFAVAGARASGANHRRFTINKGVLLVRRIACEHQGMARAECEAIATYDGTNQPVLEADSISLPAGPADTVRFSLGPVMIGSVAINGFRSVELDLGLNVTREGAGSEVWDSTVAIRDIKPKFRIRGIDYEWLKSANIPFTGKAATHANTTIYLRKRTEFAAFVADGTAEHIKLTAAGLAYIEQPFSGDGNAPVEITLCLECKYDGTNAPVTLNTASTVT